MPAIGRGCLLAIAATLAAGCGGDGGSCDDPVPPGAASCPAECTGGCLNGVCTIDCSLRACSSTIACPPDHACVIQCTGLDACDTAEIDCPSDYACTIECTGGTDACGDLTIVCGDASCDMQCEPNACIGATLECGGGGCTATCMDGATGPTVECGDSCDCIACE